MFDTHMNVDRELDKRVAEEIFGWREVHQSHYNSPAGLWFGKAPAPQPGDSPQDLCNGISYLPYYSCNIASAMKIVDHMASRMWDMYKYPGTNKWCVCVWDRDKEAVDWEPGLIRIEAETLPHAICLAALEAIRPRDDRIYFPQL